jgi:hypothetical protein
LDAEAKTTIDELFELKGAKREAKAYAFLWAAFRRTEISANPVRDALDCLIPFVAPYTNKIAGKQVTTEGIQTYLKEDFGFDIPQYAIDQLIKALAKQGFVAYRQQVKAHFAVPHESKFDVVKSEIETEFDDITTDLAAYTETVGFTVRPPPSGSWGQALIAFLRVRTDKSAASIVKIKGTLVDPSSAEMAIVAAFIRKLHTDSPEHFEKIVHIFMGVLIEDFISSVTEIGLLSLDKPVTVFYDTAVLLRQLGCSGKSLKVATDELTRYVQDLGMQIRYFSGNEAEVSNILNTIVYVKDTGGELEGETAAAIADGEITTTSLRMLQNNFPEQLARCNNFPPIMSLGQIATIAWLLKDQTIPPEKAGRELLANCFAAVRPDAEWFKYFREGIEQVVSDSLEDYSSNGTNALTIQAARRIAQDESFGSSAIVRQLNMAEILSRAEAQQKRMIEEQEERLADDRKRAEEEKPAIMQQADQTRAEELEQARSHERSAVEVAVAEAKAEILAQLAEEKKRTAHRLAQRVVTGLKILLLLALVWVVGDAFLLQNEEAHSSKTLWVLSGVLAVMTILAFADLFKFRFMEPFFDGLHKRIAHLFGG